jgi:hypothetical protein
VIELEAHPTIHLPLHPQFELSFSRRNLAFLHGKNPGKMLKLDRRPAGDEFAAGHG